MKQIHVANIDFEFELASPVPTGSLEKAWERHPICMQLQYLPLLYASADDLVAVTAYPDESFLKELEGFSWRQGAKLPGLVLLSEKKALEGFECQSWGYSKQVLKWAEDRKLKYRMPPNWTMLQFVNSKAFSFEYSTLKEAALIRNSLELETWLNSYAGKKVLKTCFGLSGKGNLIVDETASLKELIAFCEKEWRLNRPIIAEPWLNRVFDFSTQWIVGEETIDLIGSTVFETNAHGVYQGTIIGSEQSIFADYIHFLEEHKIIVHEMLTEIQKRGFFGHVGVDALLYRLDDGNIRLYPIVEINARKTMSWVGLTIQQKWFHHQTLRLDFNTRLENEPSLLPLSVPGFKPFKHHLALHVLA